MLKDESAEVDEESEARTGRLTRRKQAWDDVKGGWSGQRKGSRGEDCEAEVFDAKALSRSVKERRVGAQESVGRTGGDQQGHRGKPRDPVQSRNEKLLRRRQGQRKSFSRLLHTGNGRKLLLPQTADR